MIITGLLQMVFGLLDFLLVFSIPKLPAEFTEYFSKFFEYISAGVGILANYTPIAYLLVLFGIVIAIDSAFNIYKFIMWVLAKIPMLHIS